MGQFGQTNDLQEAIDQVTNGNAKNNRDEKSENIDIIQNQLGVPPMPEPFPAPENVAPFSDILPPSPVGDASQPPANTPTDSPVNNPIDIVNPVPPSDAAPSAPVENVSNAPVDSSTPEAAPNTEPSAEQILTESLGNTPENGDLAQVRESILKDLMPLMDKVQSTPEEKFDIYQDAMETLHDKNLIAGAYNVASQMTDETKKAESLMKLMQELDK